VSAAALGEMRLEVVLAEPQCSPDPQVRQPPGAGQVADGRYRQAQQLRYLLGGQQPVIEWHGDARLVNDYGRRAAAGLGRDEVVLNDVPEARRVPIDRRDLRIARRALQSRHRRL